MLRKLSPTLRIGIALIVAVFSTGILPTTAAYAAPPTDTTLPAAAENKGKGGSEGTTLPPSNGTTPPAQPGKSTEGKEHGNSQTPPKADPPANPGGGAGSSETITPPAQPGKSTEGKEHGNSQTPPKADPPANHEATDACDNLRGKQPEGTKCTHERDHETRDHDGKVDCEKSTTPIEHQERTRDYSWDGNEWVAGQWSDWSTRDRSERPSSEKECPKEHKFVLVCKYVGKPGVDERLKEGKNPIRVAVNSIEHNGWDGKVPGWFSDAQGRSYVLGYATKDGSKDRECPQPEVEKAHITFETKCAPSGVLVTLTNEGDRDGHATVNGESIEVAANESEEVLLDFDSSTPFQTEVMVTIHGKTFTKTVNCAPGQGAGPEQGGNVLSEAIIVQPAGQGAGAGAALPETLPVTGSTPKAFLILLASLLTYGATYLLQGRRKLHADV